MAIKAPSWAVKLAKANGAKHDVPPSYLLAIWYAESGFDQNALGDRNSDGAPYSFGIGQLHLLGAGGGMHPRDLLRPEINADISASFLRRAMTAFAGDMRLAVSAYNQGIGGASKYGLRVNKRYVDNVMAVREDFLSADRVTVPRKPKAKTPTKKKTAAKTYTVKDSDRDRGLSGIALDELGDAYRWPEIYDLNKKLIGPDANIIKAGQVLKLP